MSEEYCLNADLWPSSSQIKWITATLSILVAAYWACFFIACFIIWSYLIKGGRWRIKLMSIYYGLVVLLILARIGSI